MNSDNVNSRRRRRELVCFCCGLTEAHIRAAVENRKARTLRDVAFMTGATTGCGGCESDVELLLARIKLEQRDLNSGQLQLPLRLE
ncbi:MAG: (2Fe-2S)-binding protein [Leptospiraceae bacterium]|nr:(2Fe-2S)-binding protein [Leptospiraceae bacterium]MCB1320653.1 (2Fe-2S)-binding protein [Leptospiraceae bacterium]